MLKSQILLTTFKSCNVFNCWNASRQISTFAQPLCFQLSPYLCAQPMKKKKKPDPVIVRIREERKRRKLWREIKRLMKLDKQFKPIDEITVPYSLIDEREQRLRPKPALSLETVEQRALKTRRWRYYKHVQTYNDMKIIDKLVYSQQRALDELRSESEELYQQAVQVDDDMYSYELTGPTVTPPIKDYDSPDGQYIDQSKKW